MSVDSPDIDDAAAFYTTPSQPNPYQNMDDFIAMMTQIRVKAELLRACPFYLVQAPESFTFAAEWPKREPSILHDFADWFDAALKRHGYERFIRPRIDVRLRYDSARVLANQWRSTLLQTA